MAEGIKLSGEISTLANLAKALSHPVRIYVLKKLLGKDCYCYSGKIIEELPIGRSSLSQHLKELKYAGLIQGEINPPYIKYCLNRDNWEKAKSLFDKFFDENYELSIKNNHDTIKSEKS